MKLEINTDAVAKYTKTLERLHKSALPSAIRGALNKAAFDVKTNTMPKKAADTFEKRQPNFFKANSRFENAKGFNINTMRAIAGFVEESLKGEHNYAVKDLEQQEEGGRIGKKTFIPTKFARMGNKENKPVRSNARLSQIKNLVNVRNAVGKNAKEKFVKSSVFAGKKGYVLSKNIVWKINSIKRVNGNTVFNKTPLYSAEKGRSVKVKGTGFMKEASLESGSKMERYYIAEAERQVAKFAK